MPHLVWSQRSRFDLLRLRQFLLETNPDAVPHAIATVRRELRLLSRNPRLGRRVEEIPDSREWIISFGKAAYVVLYTIHDDAITVRAIRHSKEAGY